MPAAPSCPALPDLLGLLRQFVLQIPRGRVTTFGDLAVALGDVKAARWVATVLSAIRAEEQDKLPWHRVLLQTGRWPGSSPVEHDRQRKLLAAEGLVTVPAGLTPGFSRFTEFEGPAPLSDLMQWQRDIARLVSTQPLKSEVRGLAGLDVSYASPELAVGAWVQYSADAPEASGHFTQSQTVNFPYIPGYLTFRELPVLLSLVASAADQFPADVLLVDGSGILHPRRAGIAATLGVLIGRPTIGITKHRLHGTVEAAQTGHVVWLADKGERIGARLQPPDDRPPLYVSVGSGLSLEQAVEIVLAQLGPHGQPRPIFAADRLSRQVARSLKGKP